MPLPSRPRTNYQTYHYVGGGGADGNGTVSKQEWEEATAKDPGLVPAAWLAAPAAE